MELILDPELRTKYDKCKYVVKHWEHQFKKKNGRLPSKLDIREASNDIRYAYKTYFNMKSAALEASFQNIDGFGSDDDQENSSTTLNTPNISSTETSINYGSNFNDSLINTQDNNEKIEETNEEQMDVDPPVNSSLQNNINSDKTWGNHLNNVAETKVTKKNVFDASSSFTKKLFKNSNPSKRNLRKSLSFHHRKSETNLNASGNSSFSLSQPATSSFSGSDSHSQTFSGEIDASNVNSDDSIASINILNPENLRVTKPIEPVRMNSLNVVQAVLDEKFSTVRNVDAGWMKRVAVSAGTKLTNKSLSEGNFALSHKLNTNMQEQDDDSDDIIGDSDEEVDCKLHFSKKRKLNDASFQPNQPIQTTEQNNITNKNVQADATIEPLIVSTNSVKNVIEELAVQEIIPQEIKKVTDEQIEVKQSKPKVVKQKKTAVKASKNTKPNPVVEQTEDVTLRKSSRSRRTLHSDLNEQDEEQDPFANDEENDPDFELKPETNQNEDFEEDNEEPKDEPKTKQKKSGTRKPAASKSQPKKSTKDQKQDQEEEDENESKPYELEFSIKPRRVTVPRDSNFKNVIKKSRTNKKTKDTSKPEAPVIKTVQQQKMDKLEQKIKSGNLNDNFVRINIEKKKYSRGKKSINFSKYKKAQWKQTKKARALYGPDMYMGGCDGGQLTCFNCGQVGHFAQKCPMQKGDGLLPLAVGEENYCPFPTLEEASEMAHGSQLMVRKTRIAEAGAEVQNNQDTLKNKEGCDLDGEETNKTNEQQPLESLESEVKGVQSELLDCDSDDSENDSDNSSDDEDIPLAKTNNDMFSDDDDDLLAETLKLEEYVKKMDEQQQLIDDLGVIKPYYNRKEDGSLIDTPQEVYDVLEMFGHSSFRAGQEKAIMRILSGQSTLVTLSTGSGKSLCYQIPAYLLTKREPCIALVISPLVSLMEDQVTGIPKFLKAECLHTNKTKVQKERILIAISTGDLHILLVSPEAVVAGEKQTGFGSLLRKLPPIAFACIDEAHCVSQWSHNFRPSYLMICSILKERLGVKTILGLTATATRATSDSIISHLSIPDGRNGIISDIPLPNNLRLTVSKDGNRDAALLNLILSERFANLKSIIVYCTRRQECERIASLLRTSLKDEKTEEPDEDPDTSKKRKRKKLKMQAEPYHAGLPSSKRRNIQNSFMRGDLRIVVATVAFGMGINKSDIRAVIHYNLPKNFESYVQEVGRAGRDGLPAHCHLFLDAQGRDEDELQRHIFSDSLDRHVIRKLNSKIFVPCSCKSVCPKHEVAFSVEKTVQALDIPEENISTLLCYLELHDKKYIEVLSPAYTSCKVTAYGTANYIRKAAKDCPPLAMALAMFGNKDNDKENIFEFPIVDVAAAMGWDSGICKYKLKNLEWTNENGQPKRSFLTVQFVDLGFRLLAPGNLSGEQLDEVLDSLHTRVQNQEHCALLQLRSLHETVTECAEVTYRPCISEKASEKEIILKKRIREYFDSAQPLSLYELKPKGCDEGLIANDCRAMINMYRDNTFTGRALARIFYGIQSPNYPAVVWGRCKYWRAHINSDFHKIVQIGTKEILKHR